MSRRIRAALAILWVAAVLLHAVLENLEETIGRLRQRVWRWIR
jgi:uncharacterized membrane protein YbhN (UPF0104 family)